MARSFYLRVEPGQKFLLDGKRDGELCIVFKREHKQLQYASCPPLALAAYEGL